MPTANPTPTQDPVPGPETTVTPATNSGIKVADLEINPTTEESSEDNDETITPSPRPGPTLPPEASSEVEMANQEPAATKLLEHSWLRVQLQPETKSPTDSVEPMGLINRIKGVFVRSAGR